MTNELKNEIASWYPGITDAELNDIANNLADFYALGAKALYEAEKAEGTSASLVNDAALH